MSDFIEIETVTTTGAYVTAYPVNTPEEIEEARAALRAAGRTEAPVWSEDGEESVKTWRVLVA